jgi:hypothetical protein
VLEERKAEKDKEPATAEKEEVVKTRARKVKKVAEVAEEPDNKEADDVEEKEKDPATVINDEIDEE